MPGLQGNELLGLLSWRNVPDRRATLRTLLAGEAVYMWSLEHEGAAERLARAGLAWTDGSGYAMKLLPGASEDPRILEQLWALQEDV